MMVTGILWHRSQSFALNENEIESQVIHNMANDTSPDWYPGIGVLTARIGIEQIKYQNEIPSKNPRQGPESL